MKRVLSEPDPALRAQDAANYRQASENPDVGREALMAPHGVLGKPLPIELHAR